jgi:3alpha(or 20beta)-hydroxysteroid dehydrogenase
MAMGARLEGRYALVTGASRGIGAAIVERFVEEGARVMAADIRDELGESLAKRLGKQVTFRRLDVTDGSAWRALADEMADGSLDILVNNAGAVVSFASLHELEPREWQQIVDLNLTSVFLGMRYMIPLMIASGKGGSVVNMSSIAGSIGISVAPAYSAAKAGVRILSKGAALAYATQGVRVNTIHPGLIATPMVAEQPDWATEGFLASTPMKKMGTPVDVANAVLYLASDEAKFVTGAEIAVDGGYLAQ